MGIGGGAVGAELIARAAPDLVCRSGIDLAQRVIAVEEGRVVAGIGEARILACLAGEEGGKIRLVLAGEGHAVADLVAHRERHGGRERRGADAAFSGKGDKDAGRSRFSEPFAAQQRLDPGRGAVEAVHRFGKRLIACPGLLAELREVRGRNDAVGIALDQRRGLVGLLQKIGRDLAQLGRGALLRLQPEAVGHRRREIIQAPHGHKKEGSAAQRQQQTAEPAEKMMVHQAADQRDDAPQHDQAQARLPDGEGRDARDPGQHAEDPAGKRRIEAEKDVRPLCGRQNEQARQGRERDGGDEIAERAGHARRPPPRSSVSTAGRASASARMSSSVVSSESETRTEPSIHAASTPMASSTWLRWPLLQAEPAET